MAVGFTSTSPSGSPASGKTGTGTSFTFTGFAVSGANPTIIVAIGLQSATALVSSVVLSAGLTGGTPVEVKAQRSSAGTNKTTYGSIWAIPAPSGTGTITVTLDTSVPWQAQAFLLSGADQSTPCPTGDAASNQGNADPLIASPTNLTANDAVVVIAVDAAPTGDNPQLNAPVTTTYHDNTTAVNLAAGYNLGTGSVSATFGSIQDDDVIVAVRVAAATGGGGDLSALIGEPPTGSSALR